MGIYVCQHVTNLCSRFLPGLSANLFYRGTNHRPYCQSSGYRSTLVGSFNWPQPADIFSDTTIWLFIILFEGRCATGNTNPGYLSRDNTFRHDTDFNLDLIDPVPEAGNMVARFDGQVKWTLKFGRLYVVVSM